MSSINNYLKPSISALRGYYPEGISTIITNWSLVTTLTATKIYPDYLDKVFLLPFYIRKPINNLRICLPINDIQKDSNNNVIPGTVNFGIYLPKEGESNILESKKIYETQLFNSSILPSAGLHVLQTSLNLRSGWIYLAILIRGNAFSCRVYGSSVFRSIFGGIPYTSAGQIKDIATTLNFDGSYQPTSATYAIQIAKNGDTSYPSTNVDNSYSALPDQISNYVEKYLVYNPLAYLIY